jgi:hypothetical protein
VPTLAIIPLYFPIPTWGGWVQEEPEEPSRVTICSTTWQELASWTSLPLIFPLPFFKPCLWVSLCCLHVYICSVLPSLHPSVSFPFPSILYFWYKIQPQWSLYDE